LQKERIPDRVAQLGEHLFGTQTPDETIDNLISFFRKIDCPVNLHDTNISKDNKEEILDLMIRNKVNGIVHKLSDEDRERILDYMFEEF
jgi:alcohol dehydrogenase YqhD (iron-dependent ADH family)